MGGRYPEDHEATVPLPPPKRVVRSWDEITT
jgi:hypothetical protein